jgi:hypothetical protein
MKNLLIILSFLCVISGFSQSKLLTWEGYVKLCEDEGKQLCGWFRVKDEHTLFGQSLVEISSIYVMDNNMAYLSTQQLPATYNIRMCLLKNPPLVVADSFILERKFNNPTKKGYLYFNKILRIMVNSDLERRGWDVKYGGL